MKCGNDEGCVIALGWDDLFHTVNIAFYETAWAAKRC